MSKRVTGYEFLLNVRGELTFNMPKRARVLAVGTTDSKHGALYAEVPEDADTRAFDTGKHQRHFVLASSGGEIPADGVFVGLAGARLVFEVPGIRGSR